MTTTIMTRPLPGTTGPGAGRIRYASAVRVARAGLQETIDDITQDDDSDGLEPDDAFAKVLAAINSHRAPRHRVVRPHDSDLAGSLGAHLLDVVRRQDARIPAGWRAPRTVAEMRARLAETVPPVQAQQPCGACGGAGGRTVDTSSDGVTRQNWERCTACGGTGVAG
ncbi:hypothetical protein ACWEKM_24785 [Streptomyces sp. NPDC004752]